MEQSRAAGHLRCGFPLARDAGSRRPLQHGGRSRREKRVFFRIEVDDNEVDELAPAQLPRIWRSALNAGPCRSLGDAWLASGSSVALRVPSALAPGEFNCILNPAHPQYGKGAIWTVGRPLRIDSRLFQNLAEGA